jgi:hypothetical protein
VGRAVREASKVCGVLAYYIHPKKLMAQSLIKKLQIKSGYKMTIINPPVGYLQQLKELPEGAEIVQNLGKDLDFVQLFVKDKAELEKLSQTAFDAIKYDGIFWICYPKGTSKVDTDLNRDILWEIIKVKGLNAVSMIAVDETWSAMRFRPADIPKSGKLIR